MPTTRRTRLSRCLTWTRDDRLRRRDLSRGQRQKLAICCAYLHNPVALLFDEPLTGLDPHGIRILKRSIRSRAEQGAAVIISSHLLALVEDICSRVLMIHAGQRRFCGTLAELKETYVAEDAAATQEHPQTRKLQAPAEVSP